MTPPIASIVAVLATFTAALDYRALVDQYRKDGAPQIQQVLAPPADDVEREVRGALAPASGWSWEEVRAAAMLHTEAALRAQKNKDSRAADLHATLAQKLLDRVVELSPPQKDFAWRWYQAVPRLFGVLGASGIGKRLDAYGEAKWGHEPARASYLRGLGFEAAAGREGVIATPGDTSALGSLTVKRLEAFLIPAAEAFADALKQDRQLGCAAVHLGRIRMLQGQRNEAASLLRGAIGDVDPAVAYLAELFLGSIHERNGELDAAEKLYRSAVRRIPWGQSAPLALAELLSRAGREAEARSAVGEHFQSIGAGTIVEPLWTLSTLPADELGTRLDLLRMEVWK